MNLGIPSGMPVIDQLWVGAVVANIHGMVLAVELNADPLDVASWREYPRDQIMRSHAIAYVCRDEDDRQRVTASWHRKCGAMTACRCDGLDICSPPARRHAAPARPRAPMQAAQARAA